MLNDIPVPTGPRDEKLRSAKYTKICDMCSATGDYTCPVSPGVYFCEYCVVLEHKKYCPFEHPIAEFPPVGIQKNRMKTK